MLQSIRWSGYPAEVNYQLEVEAGTQYRLQLLFAEKCCSRGYDVFVEDIMLVDDFSPQAVQSILSIPSFSRSVKFVFFWRAGPG